ncbi:MAG TPA: CRISPR-associated endonuclease Cas1 [Candidatus Competibacteraceae bacterium]|nr:CRISPR-associated endonuclease Cas1 [Candidatus Competibacteraceae bacterium]
MKPLYLQGRPGLAVTLEEPALSVHAPGRAPRLYPLARVSRVIASGPVQWSTEALMACAERGITVSFLHTDGRVRAYLLGETTGRAALYQRLRDLLDRPDWPALYADWYRAMDSLGRRALLKRLGLDPLIALPAPRLLRQLAGLKACHANPRVLDFIERRLDGLCRALAVELLAAAGIGAERAATLDARLDLPGDLARLLGWDLHLPLLAWLERQPAARPVADAALVALFESRIRRLRRIGRYLVQRLYVWLLDLPG